MKFQEQIISLYKKWDESLADKTIVENMKKDDIVYPLLPQLDLQINEREYHSFLQDLFTVMKEYQSELTNDLNQMESLLDNDTLHKWFTEAIAVNSYYFNEFAKKNNLPEWLPLFAAEHAARPFLHKAAEELNGKHEHAHEGSCPVCGEPSRIAFINKEGKKEINCPRCHHAWEEKKISCAHCGNEEKGEIVVLRVEKEDQAEIYACKKCKGYTKVIDTRKLLVNPGPELLDLKTIHLDYIAQENGYGVEDGSDTEAH